MSVANILNKNGLIDPAWIDGTLSGVTLIDISDNKHGILQQYDISGSSPPVNASLFENPITLQSNKGYLFNMITYSDASDPGTYNFLSYSLDVSGNPGISGDFNGYLVDSTYISFQNDTVVFDTNGLNSPKFQVYWNAQSKTAPPGSKSFLGYTKANLTQYG